jgi:hypothetical protein
MDVTSRSNAGFDREPGSSVTIAAPADGLGVFFPVGNVSTVTTVTQSHNVCSHLFA